MHEHEEAIHLTIDSIWSQMFDLRVGPDPTVGPGDPPDDLSERASVTMQGQRDVEIVLHCSRPLVTVLASIIFDLAPDDVDDELRDDTMAELVNMIAGNVKVILPTPTQLSLPVIACPDGGVRAWPRAAATRYRCLDEPFLVTVHLAEPAFTTA